MEPLMLFLTLSTAIFFVFIAWFFLLADCDLSLTLNTIFGRPVSVFKGKVVWITGASSGLGAAMAYELASVGARLILSARNTERLEQVKEKCLDTSKGRLKSEDILVLPFDITNCDVHQEKFNNALHHFQQVDVLINNAGRYQNGCCEKTSIDVDRELFDINYFGPVSLCKIVLRHFKERQNGQILVISSLSGKFGSPGVATYCATKEALQGFHDTVRKEHEINNIKVTVACPGFFESEMAKSVMTETKGEIHQNIINCDVQMPTSRCAHLSLVAAANNSNEVWISYQPFLFFTYVFQYMPDIGKLMFSMICTKQIISECIQGRYPKAIPAWKPLFS